MDLSRLRRSEIVGALAGVVLILSLGLQWFTLTGGPERMQQNAYVCGQGDLTCSGFETFPILRWLLILAALAPMILAYLIVTEAELSWPAGELTTIVGFTAITLIGYNGIVDKPGNALQEFGVSLSYGYWIAMLAAVMLTVAGGIRTVESGGGAPHKPPGTF
ncbi:MAG: hypothetical protein ABR536_01110 [Solirubrobacterales bacterium]